ncbi:hypothetical protein ROZALSC1DRAFT_25814, partial [Rozella allomycis CSF55]
MKKIKSLSWKRSVTLICTFLTIYALSNLKVPHSSASDQQQNQQTPLSILIECHEDCDITSFRETVGSIHFYSRGVTIPPKIFIGTSSFKPDSDEYQEILLWKNCQFIKVSNQLTETSNIVVIKAGTVFSSKLSYKYLDSILKHKHLSYLNLTESKEILQNGTYFRQLDPKSAKYHKMYCNIMFDKYYFDNYDHFKLPLSFKTTIGLGVPVLGKGIGSIRSLPLIKYLIPTLNSTISSNDLENFRYVLYIGFDRNDNFFKKYKNRVEVLKYIEKYFPGQRIL